jgi:hypothetical protein
MFVWDKNNIYVLNIILETVFRRYAGTFACILMNIKLWMKKLVTITVIIVRVDFTGKPTVANK